MIKLTQQETDRIANFRKLLIKYYPHITFSYRKTNDGLRFDFQT